MSTEKITIEDSKDWLDLKEAVYKCRNISSADIVKNINIINSFKNDYSAAQIESIKYIAELNELYKICTDQDVYEFIHARNANGDWAADLIESYEDITNIPNILYYHINWDHVATDLLYDYTALDVLGETYYYR